MQKWLILLLLSVSVISNAQSFYYTAAESAANDNDYNEAVRLTRNDLEISKRTSLLNYLYALEHVYTYFPKANPNEDIKPYINEGMLLVDSLWNENENLGLGLYMILSSALNNSKYHKEAVSFREKLYKHQSDKYGEISDEAMYELCMIGCYYRDAGDYDNAIKYMRQATDLCKILFKDNPHREYRELNYEECLKTLIYAFCADGKRIAEAVKYSKEYCAYLRNIYGQTSKRYQEEIGNLSQFFYRAGNLELSAIIEKECALYGPISEIQYALSNILTWDKNIKYDPEADKYAERLFDVIINDNYNKVVDEKALKAKGYKLTDEHSACFILQQYYSAIGSHKKAFSMCKRLYDKLENDTINTVMLNYMIMEGSNCSKDTLDYIIQLGEEALSHRKMDKESTSLLKLSMIDAYKNSGMYDKALQIGEELVTEKPDYLNFFTLITLQTTLGKYKDAYSTIKLMDCKIENLRNNPRITISYVPLAWQNGDYSKVDSLLPTFIKGFKEYIYKLPLLTETQRSKYMQQCPFFHRGVEWNWIIRLDKNLHLTSCNEAAYDYALLTKGVLLYTNSMFQKSILESKNDELIKKYNTFLKLQKESDKNDIQYNVLEKELLQAIYHDESLTDKMFCNWKDVQASLKDDEVAIEFVKSMGIHAFYNPDIHPYYYALILRKDYTKPKIVQCASLYDVEDFVACGKDLYNNRLNESIDPRIPYSLFWKRIQPYLDGVKTIYYSPIDDLHSLALESFLDDNFNYASDHWDIHRVSSTRVLCQNMITKIPENAILYGGLNYDSNSEALEKVNVKFKSNTVRGLSTFTHRGETTNVRARFNNLTFTLPEIRNIEQLMSNKRGLSYSEFVEDNGTEESFYSLTGRNINILHFATHGFYFDKKSVEEKELEKEKFRFMVFEDNDSVSAEDRAMTHSGLLLSGANNTLRGDSLPHGMEDGILTAQEISNVYFDNLDLVVLSACQTGLGQIGNEGVFGLQRGFKKAGAQSLLMSLWEVDDKATSTFMQEFYRNYLSGKSKTESLKSAQLKLRQTEEFADPEKWAGWILLDALN